MLVSYVYTWRGCRLFIENTNVACLYRARTSSAYTKHTGHVCRLLILLYWPRVSSAYTGQQIKVSETDIWTNEWTDRRRSNDSYVSACICRQLKIWYILLSLILLPLLKSSETIHFLKCMKPNVINIIYNI